MARSRRSLLAGLLTGGLVSGVAYQVHSRSQNETDVPPRASSTTAWPTYNYDLQNTGHRRDADSIRDNPSTAWQETLRSYPARGAAVAGDTVYVGGTLPGNLYSFDVRTGETEWVFSEGSVDTLLGFTTTPALHGDWVYATSQDGRTYCLSRKTGDVQWSFATDRSFDASPAVVNSTVYVVSDRLYALDAETGDRRHDLQFDAPIRATPAVADGTAYVGTEGGTLAAVDLEAWATDWEISLDGAVVHAPVFRDGLLYVSDSTGRLLALDSADGRTRWTFDRGSRIATPPAVTSDAVILATSDPGFYSLRTDTGDVAWEAIEPGVHNASPTVMDGTVYAAAGDELVGLDVATGEVTTRISLGNDVVTSPVAAGNAIFVGTETHNFYALA